MEKRKKILRKTAMGLSLVTLALIILSTFEERAMVVLLTLFGAGGVCELTGILKKLTPGKKLFFYILIATAVIFIPFTQLMIVLYRIGWEWIIFVAGCCYGNDVGSFFFGSLATPLLPWKAHVISKVSPNKTWEAFLFGGMPVAMLSCLFFMFVWPKTPPNFFMQLLVWPASPILKFTTVVTLGALMGLAGDLFESSFKRKVGIDDSSRALGSHGGFLDRIDSLLGTSLLFIFMYLYLVK